MMRRGEILNPTAVELVDGRILGGFLDAGKSHRIRNLGSLACAAGGNRVIGVGEEGGSGRQQDVAMVA